jgi:hypothetical protein
VRAALLALLLPGCAYRVTLASRPSAVTVALPDGSRVTTPAEVRLRWVPFGHQRVTATADGYRPLTVDLRRDEIRWSRFVIGTIAHPSVLSGKPRGEVELVLIPEHGPVGSWTEDDIP